MSSHVDMAQEGHSGPSSLSAVPRLSLRGIAKSFDTNVVLSGIDLDVYEGELVALLGENGAGKSTLSSIIAGLYPPSGGSMTWEGRPYAPTRPGEAIDAGIVLIHQEMRLLPQLSIAENVFVGRLLMKGDRIDRETSDVMGRMKVRPKLRPAESHSAKLF